MTPSCDHRRLLFILLWLVVLPNLCHAAEPPVFEYQQHYHTLIVFLDNGYLKAYGLGKSDNLEMQCVIHGTTDEPWQGRTLRIEYNGCYRNKSELYPWLARSWLTADRLIIWNAPSFDPLPVVIWAWPRMGIKYPSPDEVLAATPPAMP